MAEERRDDRWFWIALAGIVAIGAWLRFRLLGVPSLWLDELLNYDIVTAAVRQPWHAWLVGFEVENGPLYYALQLASRIVSDVELTSRLAPAVIGTATVAIIGVLGRRLSLTVGIVAAILAAVSPFHVYYSREGRVYALLMLFATLVLFAFVDGRKRAPGVSIAALVGAAFTAATAAPLVVAAGATAIFRLPFSRRRAVDLATLAGAAAGVGILALHYLDFDRPKPALGMPPVDFVLVAKIVNGFTVTAFEIPQAGLLPWALVAVAIFGATATFRRDRATGVALAAMTLLPVIVTIVALSVMRHWFSIRYVSFAFPPFLLLVAIGIEALAGFLKPIPISRAAALVAALAIGGVNIPNALHEPLRRVDWRGAAAFVSQHVRRGDPVIASNAWSMVCVSFYLRHFGSPLQVISAEESPDRLKQLVQDRPAWIVEGGWHSNPAIQESLAKLCEVWTSETTSQFESLRVRFSPSCEAFLRSRVTSGDVALLQRWFVLERGSRLEMTDNDARFLVQGWSGPEHDPTGPTFRWVAGRRATVILPISGPRGAIRFRARALGYLNAPPQNLVAFVNGRRALAATLTDAWSEHRIVSDALRPGLNELTFELSRATRPVDLDPAATDQRELSVAFDFIEVADAPR